MLVVHIVTLNQLVDLIQTVDGHLGEVVSADQKLTKELHTPVLPFQLVVVAESLTRSLTRNPTRNLTRNDLTRNLTRNDLTKKERVLASDLVSKTPKE